MAQAVVVAVLSSLATLAVQTHTGRLSSEPAQQRGSHQATARLDGGPVQPPRRQPAAQTPGRSPHSRTDSSTDIDTESSSGTSQALRTERITEELVWQVAFSGLERSADAAAPPSSDAAAAPGSSEAPHSERKSGSKVKPWCAACLLL